MRCAIYTRFSSDMQSPRSVGDQERECKAFAERQGWEVVLARSDEAVRAGAIAGRVGYAALLDAAKRRQFDILIVEEVSRFSRDFLGGLAELAQLGEFDVSLADTKQGLLDLKSPVGQLSVAFGLVSSQAETQRLGERTKRGLKGKVLSKFSPGGQPPYGYSRVPVYSETERDVDGRPIRVGVRFEPHPLEAPVIVRIYQLYLDGESKHAIARRLNEEGVASRRAGGSRVGRKNSGTWSTVTVRNALQNRLYLGEKIWNKSTRTGKKLPVTGKKKQLGTPEQEWVVVKGFATPIIDQELWDAAQRRFQADAEKYKARHVVNNDRRYLLSGLLRCGNCGGHFVVSAHRGTPPVPHYRCSFQASRGRVVCGNPVTVPVPGLEDRVRRTLDVIIKDPKNLELLVADHNRRVAATNEAQRSVVRALEARRTSLEKQQINLIDAVKLGTGSAKLLVGELDAITAKIGDLDRRIKEADRLVQPLLLPTRRSVTDYLTGAASVFSGDFVEERKLVEQVIDTITVFANGTLLLRFREESLFEPVRHVLLSGPQLKAQEAIEKVRRDYLATFQKDSAGFPADQRNRMEVDVEVDKDGNPAFVTMTKGAVQRTFGHEITLASPTRFELVYQG